MAVGYTGTHIERVSAELTGDVTTPFRVTTVWQAIRVSNGAVIEHASSIDYTSTAPLDQGEFDAMWSEADGVFATLTGGTGPTVNPVVI